MTEIKKSVLDDVMQSIPKRNRDELLARSQEELANGFWFSYNALHSPAWNLYEFSGELESYRRRCRTWEEHHNGNVCVVERVRDIYLAPKIYEFLAALARERGY